MYVSVKNKCEQEAGHNTSDYRYSMSGFPSWLQPPVPTQRVQYQMIKTVVCTIPILAP